MLEKSALLIRNGVLMNCGVRGASDSHRVHIVGDELTFLKATTNPSSHMGKLMKSLNVKNVPYIGLNFAS
ncbi:hypothetical protein ACFL9T_14175 [Thermodesulfobacteriota bacterium]